MYENNLDFLLTLAKCCKILRILSDSLGFKILFYRTVSIFLHPWWNYLEAFQSTMSLWKKYKIMADCAGLLLAPAKGYAGRKNPLYLFLWGEFQKLTWHHLSFNFLGFRSSIRSINSTPFQNPGKVPWAWQTDIRTDIQNILRLILDDYIFILDIRSI